MHFVPGATICHVTTPQLQRPNMPSPLQKSLPSLLHGELLAVVVGMGDGDARTGDDAAAAPPAAAVLEAAGAGVEEPVPTTLLPSALSSLAATMALLTHCVPGATGCHCTRPLSQSAYRYLLSARHTSCPLFWAVHRRAGEGEGDGDGEGEGEGEADVDGAGLGEGVTVLVRVRVRVRVRRLVTRVVIDGVGEDEGVGVGVGELDGGVCVDGAGVLDGSGVDELLLLDTTGGGSEGVELLDGDVVLRDRVLVRDPVLCGCVMVCVYVLVCVWVCVAMSGSPDEEELELDTAGVELEDEPGSDEDEEEKLLLLEDTTGGVTGSETIEAVVDRELLGTIDRVMGLPEVTTDELLELEETELAVTVTVLGPSELLGDGVPELEETGEVDMELLGVIVTVTGPSELLEDEVPELEDTGLGVLELELTAAEPELDAEDVVGIGKDPSELVLELGVNVGVSTRSVKLNGLRSVANMRSRCVVMPSYAAVMVINVAKLVVGTSRLVGETVKVLDCAVTTCVRTPGPS